MTIVDSYSDTLLNSISTQDLMPSLEAITTILRILTIFSLYQDAVEDGKAPLPAEQKYNDFCVVMKDMLCETWRLFYLLFRRISGVSLIKETQNENEDDRKKISRCCELLSILHEELGVHKWCASGNGNVYNSRRLTFRKSFRINDGSIFKI
jgi:hypothetical protein